MATPECIRLLEALRSGVDGDGPPPLGDESRIPVAYYRSPERLEAERALFRETPAIIGHESEVPEPGDCITNADLGVPVIVVRGKDARLRAFINTCRHRGTTLVDSPCKKKAFVCPYHGWTYDLDGALRHVPHEEAFPTLDKSRSGLVELPLAVRHGFLWVVATPGGNLDVDAYLQDLSPDFDAFGLDDHVLFRRSRQIRRANWKLLVDVFLEGYHIRTLHRDSIYPFFLDAQIMFDRVGPHGRGAAARRKIRDEPDAPLREQVTFTYSVFPSTTVLFHPDYVSRMTAYPVAVDRFQWVHDMMVPVGRAGEREHWDRSFDLIEGKVFGAEDLGVAESMQVGLESGANESLVMGTLEAPVAWFHQNLSERLARR